MSPPFIGNSITERQKSKPIEVVFSIFCSEKIICKETKRTFQCLYASRSCIDTWYQPGIISMICMCGMCTGQWDKWTERDVNMEYCIAFDWSSRDNDHKRSELKTPDSWTPVKKSLLVNSFVFPNRTHGSWKIALFHNIQIWPHLGFWSFCSRWLFLLSLFGVGVYVSPYILIYSFLCMCIERIEYNVRCWLLWPDKSNMILTLKSVLAWFLLV